MIGLSTSSFYYRPKTSRAERARKDAQLRDEIEGLQAEQPTLGYRTVRENLLRKGQRINSKRIRRVMTEFGLAARIKRRFIRTTDSRHGFRTYPNLIAGKEVTGINQVWVADITYIRILTGFVFLAVLMDLFSRRIVGWALSKSLDHSLTLEALKIALARRNPSAGMIHHSDHGVQYACTEYVETLTNRGIIISMAAKGNPYQNAFAESFFKTFKTEEVYLWEYESFVDVVERVPYFIEEVYNKKRLHSGIRYLPPEEFEEILKDEHRKNQLGQINLKVHEK
jgi:transposase InsO family protein